MQPADTDAVSRLNRLLRIELAAVEAYDGATPRLCDPYVRQQLEECQRSHQMRVDILREEVEDLGGEPAPAGDPAMPDLAAARGDDTIVAVLHKHEDRLLVWYRTDLDSLDFDVRDLVEGDLLPEQERTIAITTSVRQEH